MGLGLPHTHKGLTSEKRLPEGQRGVLLLWKDPEELWGCGP